MYHRHNLIVHKIVEFCFHFRHCTFKSILYSMIRKDTEAVSRIPFRRSSFLPLFFPTLSRETRCHLGSGFFILIFSKIHIEVQQSLIRYSNVTACRSRMSMGHPNKQKRTPTVWLGLVFALLIFPGSRPPSIVSVHELNFCVRDGNRWTLMTINTNSFGWVLPIFYMSKPFRVLTALVTHTGFEPMLTA